MSFFIFTKKEKQITNDLFHVSLSLFKILIKKGQDNSLNRAKLNLCDVCCKKYNNFSQECAATEEL